MCAQFTSPYYQAPNYNTPEGLQNNSVPNYNQRFNTQPTGPNFYNGVPFAANQFIPDMAMQYGSDIITQGANKIQNDVNQYMSVQNIKNYFAVNHAYVTKKIGLILFPFFHTKWGTNFNSGPVLPSDDINTPDLYIPLMASITYILFTGIIYGMQGRFSPEYLGILSSQAFGWILFEVLLSLFAIYILNIQSNISYLDLIAFSGYKFVSMIATLFAYVILDRAGYYFALMYTSLAFAFFLIRTLKFKVLSHTESYPDEGTKRRVYLLLIIAFVQPFIMWWLTSHTMNNVKLLHI